jgi:hypothetical protein
MRITAQLASAVLLIFHSTTSDKNDVTANVTMIQATGMLFCHA